MSSQFNYTTVGAFQDTTSQYIPIYTTGSPPGYTVGFGSSDIFLTPNDPTQPAPIQLPIVMFGTSTIVLINQNTDQILFVGPHSSRPGIFTYTGGVIHNGVLSAHLIRIGTWAAGQTIPVGTTVLVTPNTPVVPYPEIFNLLETVVVATTYPTFSETIPVVLNNNSTHATPNEPYTGQLTAEGGFPPYTFQGTGTTTGGSVVVNSNGSFTFTPNTGVLVGTFQFEAQDSHSNLSNIATFTIFFTPAVNAENEILGPFCSNSTQTGSLSATGGVPPYVFSLVAGSIVGGESVQIPTTAGSSGSFTFFPSTDFSGTASFEYIATDSLGAPSLPATVTLNYTTPVVTMNQCFEAIVCEVQKAVLDISGGTPPYTFNIFSGPTLGCLKSISTSKGKVIFLYKSKKTGTDMFTYNVTDANGCQSNNSDVTITVTNCKV